MVEVGENPHQINKDLRANELRRKWWGCGGSMKIITTTSNPPGSRAGGPVVVIYLLFLYNNKYREIGTRQRLAGRGENARGPGAPQFEIIPTTPYSHHFRSKSMILRHLTVVGILWWGGSVTNN